MCVGDFLNETCMNHHFVDLLDITFCHCFVKYIRIIKKSNSNVSLSINDEIRYDKQ